MPFRRQPKSRHVCCQFECPATSGLDGGRPWNRTRHGSPRRSYSPLPHLAARRPTGRVGSNPAGTRQGATPGSRAACGTRGESSISVSFAPCCHQNPARNRIPSVKEARQSTMIFPSGPGCIAPTPLLVDFRVPRLRRLVTLNASTRPFHIIAIARLQANPSSSMLPSTPVH